MRNRRVAVAGEYAAFKNMLTSFPVGTVACVSDSYDIYKVRDTNSALINGFPSRNPGVFCGASSRITVPCMPLPGTAP